MAKTKRQMISDLVDAYNETEAEQTARLEQIFELIRARRGYRALYFGARAGKADTRVAGWTNCWDVPLQQGLERQVHPQARRIIETHLGEAS